VNQFITIFSIVIFVTAFTVALNVFWKSGDWGMVSLIVFLFYSLFTVILYCQARFDKLSDELSEIKRKLEEK